MEDYIPLPMVDHAAFVEALRGAQANESVLPSLSTNVLPFEPAGVPAFAPVYMPPATAPSLEDKFSWQQFVMHKNYELANSKDPDISAKALDRLAKTSVVGLNEQRVQLALTQLPQEELQKKIETLVNHINERVVGTV